MRGSTFPESYSASSLASLSPCPPHLIEVPLVVANKLEALVGNMLCAGIDKVAGRDLIRPKGRHVCDAGGDANQVQPEVLIRPKGRQVCTISPMRFRILWCLNPPKRAAGLYTPSWARRRSVCVLIRLKGRQVCTATFLTC